MDNLDKIINEDDVVSIDDREDNILMGHYTYQSGEFLNQLCIRIGCNKKDKWLTEGVPCKLLSPNQGWQKGKVKICLQFIPEQAESILDDIRLSNQ
jgi:hypothetical protein